LAEIPGKLTEFIIAAQARAEQVPASNEGTDIDATIAAARTKLGTGSKHFFDVADDIQVRIRVYDFDRIKSRSICVILSIILCSGVTIGGLPLMTYSISARCPATGAFGIAITSSSIAVPARCAWVGPLGLVVTQNVTDPALGPAGLSLLRQGLGAAAVLTNLTLGTPEPEWRQVGVIDRYGCVAWRSGALALPVAAAAEGAGCLALGNLLADKNVPAVMIGRFEATAGEALAERLLSALEAGGETGDEHAAGLHVAHGFDWPVVDLRVDWHDMPIAELRALWERYRPQQKDYIARAINPRAAPSF
jgi:uncharacterized Ntn-hydrolase superfamily protein